MATPTDLYEPYARELLRRIAAAPRDPGVLRECGHELLALGRAADALPWLRRAVELAPERSDNHARYAQCLMAHGRYDEAESYYVRAADLDPRCTPLVRFALHQVAFARGDVRRGFRLQNERLRWVQFRDGYAATSGHVQRRWWRGDSLAGRTLWVRDVEVDGFGDILWLSRFLPLLRAGGARVVLECRPTLRRLFEASGIADQYVGLGAYPHHDAQTELFSVPAALGTTLDTIPATVPYLQAPALDRARFPELALPDEPGSDADAGRSLRVGIVWRPRPVEVSAMYRGMPLSALSPLARVAGVRLYSLQVGDGAAEARTPPDGMALTDLGPRLKDWADTAAVMAALDLIVTVDTAPLHLAGALARPVWGLLSVAADGIWMRDTDRSPWYPTLRLYRQDTLGDWASVVGGVAEDLAALATERQAA